MTINGGSSLHTIEGLAWILQQQYERGGGNIGEVQSLTFQGEHSMSVLNWLCLTMTFLEALF